LAALVFTNGYDATSTGDADFIASTAHGPLIG
jgi:hypothetical protein